MQRLAKATSNPKEGELIRRNGETRDGLPGLADRFHKYRVLSGSHEEQLFLTEKLRSHLSTRLDLL